MTTIADLRRLISAYLGGTVPLEVLDAAVAAMGEGAATLSTEAAELWGTIELRLAEFTSGVLDEAELRGELITLAPVNIILDQDPETFVISTTMTSSQPTGRVLDAPNLRFPGVDTRLAAGRA
jgi:hypothetical protein